MANGNGYSAGNLEFSVQQISNAAMSSLDRLISKLETTMNLLGNVSSLTKNLGTTVGKGTGGGAFSKTREGSTYRTSRGKTYLQQSTEMKMLGGEIAKVTTKFNEQGKVLKTVTTRIDESGKKITEIVDKTNKSLSAFKLSDLFNKIYFIRNYTKQMLRSVVEMVNRAVDYTETLNLWQVAMRGNTEEAEEFIKTMNKGYGIATQTLMEYQAIFKNMLSSLGGLSSDTSYALSEYLTQMALDYASLYNTSIERAMTTFQSVLSGQVRPIRSIAGYDITETTIYQLYQQLGGTKTMRQLSQTEKRLLRIYAVFQQMESSGAVGDLGKTMGSTANQMRVFSESTKELYTWFGMLLESVIKPILPWLNAVTITLTNIIKAILQMKGIKPQEFGIVESVQELNEELDKTQGKLLSFDRFEALNSGASEDNILGIDANLLAGLSKYESVITSIGEETERLLESWNQFWFVEGDPTKGLTDGAKDLLNILKAISITLGVLISYKLITKIGRLFSAITGLTSATKLLNAAILSGLVYVIIKAVEAFDKGDTIAGIFAITVGVSLVTAFIYLNAELIKTTGIKIGKFFTDLNKKIKESHMLTNKLAGAILQVGIAFSGAMLILGLIPEESRGIVGGIMAIVGAVTTLTLGILALQGVIKGPWVIPAITASIGIGLAGASTILNVERYKTGGLVEDGLFTMNKGEVMGTFDDGTSIVANNQQIISGIQQGVYSAVVSAMRQSGNGGVGDVYLDGRKVGHTTARYSHQENVRTGLVKATR